MGSKSVEATSNDRERRVEGYVITGAPTAWCELWVEPSPRVLRLNHHGSWTIALAHVYEALLAQRLRLFGGAPFSAVCDLRTFPGQTEEVRAVVAHGLRQASHAGMDRLALVSGRPRAALALQHLGLASLHSQVESFDEERPAREWIRNPASTRRRAPRQAVAAMEQTLF